MGGLLDMLSAIFWVAALLGIGYVLVRVFGSSDSVDGLEVVRLNDCAHHTPLFGEAVHRAL